MDNLCSSLAQFEFQPEVADDLLPAVCGEQSITAQTQTVNSIAIPNLDLYQKIYRFYYIPASYADESWIPKVLQQKAYPNLAAKLQYLSQYLIKRYKIITEEIDFTNRWLQLAALPKQQLLEIVDRVILALIASDKRLLTDGRNVQQITNIFGQEKLEFVLTQLATDLPILSLSMIIFKGGLTQAQVWLMEQLFQDKPYGLWQRLQLFFPKLDIQFNGKKDLADLYQDYQQAVADLFLKCASTLAEA
jgi:hypothetical protein